MIISKLRKITSVFQKTYDDAPDILENYKNYLKRKKRKIYAFTSSIAIFLAIFAYGYFKPSAEYKQIYREYYAHYYLSYSKRVNSEKAHYYASYYADYYAKYYTSKEYLENLDFALPESLPRDDTYAPSIPEVAVLKTSQAGIELIKHFEGFRATPYLDAGGKLTIGYGHLIRRGDFFDKISEKEAARILEVDIAIAEGIVKKYVKRPLNVNQFSALVSLVYNIGERQFRESRLLRMINESRDDQLVMEFFRWRHVNKRELDGLIRRREAEVRLYFS